MKVKKIYLFSILILVAISMYSQDNSEYWILESESDYFWQPNCPIMEGYPLFFLRQKMELNGFQTILQSEYNINDESLNKVRFTSYLPFIIKGDFKSMIGTRYNKFDVHSNQDNLNNTLQSVWLWTAWQYKLDKWLFTLTTENYFHGDNVSLYAKTGNRFFSIFYTGYEFNSYWSLILLTGFDIQKMEGESIEKPIIALQGRYQPSTRFKLLFGAPSVFALEWTMLPKTDIGFHYFITNEKQIFIRQRFSKNISASFQYNSTYNKSNAIYFSSQLLNTDTGIQTAFNNISLNQQQLYTEIGFSLLKEIGFNIGFGYNIESKMELYNNNAFISDNYKTIDNLFINCTLQYIKLR